MFKNRRRRLGLAAGGAALAAVSVAGCHVQADLVCQRYALRNHVAVQAYWSFDTDRYVCLSVNQITSVRDRYYVYEIRQPNGDISFLRRD